MYAVIRAGGKQYRVAPGDVIRVETQEDKDGKVEFGDVLAVSAEAGSVVPAGAGALGAAEGGEEVKTSKRPGKKATKHVAHAHGKKSAPKKAAKAKRK